MALEVENKRYLTKKRTIKGLTRDSWAISMLISGSLYPHIVFYSLILFVCLLVFFYIVEFFDIDLVGIVIARLKLGAGNEFYA